MTTGWVKLHRKMLDKGWMSRPEYIAVWVYLLLEASHQSKEVMWNGKIKVLKPGQFVTGRKVISRQLNISESNVQRILKFFENEHQIEQLTSVTSRLISIKNWAKYQEREQPNEQRMNNERTTNEQRMDTKQERKNERMEEGKSSIGIVEFTPPTQTDIQSFIFTSITHVAPGEIQKIAEKFHDYYSAKGWKLGRYKMKDWQAALRNWIRNEENYKNQHTHGNNSTGKPGKSSSKIGRMEVDDIVKMVNMEPNYPPKL